MIFDTLDNLARYDGLGHNLPRALKFLAETDLATLPIGRIDIDGDDLYAMTQEYLTKPAEQGKWEAHRKYIDIQYVIGGTERMGFANLRTMQVGEYVPERDFLSMNGTGSFVDVFAGSFVIFFPEDGHMPCLCADEPQQVRKVVLKVKV
ncbi:MAG: YhcH/YjgK/YiaL family protein [Chloroflexi bacterium]|nr:YhcH/YjgK/YiaL family protein [Chloroflexota bacterium]